MVLSGGSLSNNEQEIMIELEKIDAQQREYLSSIYAAAELFEDDRIVSYLINKLKIGYVEAGLSNGVNLSLEKSFPTIDGINTFCIRENFWYFDKDFKKKYKGCHTSNMSQKLKVLDIFLIILYEEYITSIRRHMTEFGLLKEYSPPTFKSKSLHTWDYNKEYVEAIQSIYYNSSDFNIEDFEKSGGMSEEISS